jgi:asparagine synthase (glutamine-hydrolysing)
MGKLCGWITHDQPAADVLAVVRGMLPGCSESDVASRASGVVAARPDVIPATATESNGLLIAIGGRVRGTDAAKLADLYKRLGERCLEHVSGSFSLAILDPQTGSGLLAVDRMGTRGLCYASHPRGLVFGSTAEAVAAHPGVGRQVSRQALFNYLYCHMVPSPGTIFREVQKLQPGECVVFRNGAAQPRFYWTMRYTDQAAESIDVLESRFRGLLRESAARAIGGDSEIGAFLSGGTDSSTVAGLLTETRGRPARTYSIGFEAEGFDEMEYARITARHFGTDAHEYYVTPQDVADTIPNVAQAYDEPFGNASAVPTYLCARMARADGVKVMLAGDGGDEIFGGNARYALQRVFQGYWALPTGLRRRVIEPIMLRPDSPSAIAPWRKLKSYVRQAAVPLPDRLETYNFLHRAPLSDIFEGDFLQQVNPEEPLRLQRAAYERAAARSYVDRMMHLDLKFTLADNDLRKVSRMCELAGIEVRYPLIDDALVAFSGELPADLKVKGLALRYFFKRALRDFLPPETIAKTKHGFGLPFGVWLREHPPLKALVHENLGAFGRRGILKSTYVGDLLRQHESTHATYYGVMIWIVMMLEQWLAARKL